MDTLPTEIMVLCFSSLSLGNRLISLGNAEELPKRTSAATVFKDIMANRWNRAFTGYAGHPDQAAKSQGTIAPIPASNLNMRLAMLALWCVRLIGISAAQAAPPAKQPTSSVAGQVVQYPGGTPLRKVLVSLTSTDG